MWMDAEQGACNEWGWFDRVECVRERERWSLVEKRWRSVEGRRKKRRAAVRWGNGGIISCMVGGGDSHGLWLHLRMLSKIAFNEDTREVTDYRRGDCKL